MKEISIIIPTVNSPWLDQVLTQLKKQLDDLGLAAEVIVAGLDQARVAAAKPWVTFLDTQEIVWPATARNLALKQAQGDILCFLDDDCIPQPNWLRNLLSPHQQGRPVVGGSVLFARPNYWTGCDTLAFFAPVLADVASGWRDYLPSLNLSLQRQVFEAVGGFDERFRVGEDTQLSLRIRQAGYQLWFAAEAPVLHTAYRRNGRELWQRAWAAGQIVALDQRMQALLHPAPIFRHWLGITLTAIPRAMIATYRIFQHHPSLLQYWPFAVGVGLNKLAWQLGAAAALRRAKAKSTNHV